MPKGKGRPKIDKQKERATRREMRKERSRQRYTKNDPEYQSLTKQLFIQGLKLKDVPGDGNCLFRALADQLNDCHVNHRSLRTDIVEHMRKFKQDFEPFIEEEGLSFEEYIADMMKDGSYGGNDSIVAFANCYDCTVVIHQPDAPRWEVHGRSSASVGCKPRKSYNIAYLNGEHYCSVVPLVAESPPLHATSSQQFVSRKKKQTTPHTSHSGADGMHGMCDGSDLATVMKITGCKDDNLARKILEENCLDKDMAIVELLQIMDLSTDVSSPSSPIPSLSDPLPKPPPPLPMPSKGPESAEISQTRQKSKRPDQHQHVSNRERKEMAKKERKERRIKERKKMKEEEEMSAAKDPVGSLLI